MPTKSKQINGFSLYEISDHGKIIFTKKQRVITQIIDKDGYLKVSLKSDNGRFYMKSVHRLVMESFSLNFDKNLQVNHINGVKHDNRLINLELVTRKQNMAHAKNVLNKKFQWYGEGNSSFRGWVIGTSIKTGNKIIFEGKQCLIDAGFKPGCVYDCFAGKQKTHKNYIWGRSEKIGEALANCFAKSRSE